MLGDRVQVLQPPDAKLAIAGGKIVGRRSGQAWEQWELPGFAKDGILINLGNTGPVLARRQVVVMHDAGVFSTPEAYSWKFRLWYKALQYLLIKRGAHIVTVSAFSRQEISQNLPISPADIAVIPEGADHMAALTANDDILRPHGLQPGKFVFAVGNLAAHKNLFALRDLADRLAARGLVLAISGAFGAAAYRGGAVNQLPSSARYLGRVSDAALKALYSNAACYVLPSSYEGFGLPAVEAMHCGCAVAAADIPALRETCGSAAVFFNPAAPGDIAEKVMALIDAPDRLAKLRIQALAHVRGMTWANAARALGNIIDALYGDEIAEIDSGLSPAKAVLAIGQTQEST
jgi:glycosyltransferase involved in cell wall biosynthesis